MERVEFERMVDDAKFFTLAVDRADAGPLERLKAVAPLLIDLEKVSDDLHTEDTDARTRTSREIADTRGDLLSWVAYQSDHLYEPLPTSGRAGRERARSPRRKRFEATERPPIKSVEVSGKLDNNDLSDGAIRAWALIQAQIIYNGSTTRGSRSGAGLR